MKDPSAIDETSTNIRWQSIPADSVPSPLVWESPYLELKLEHPDVDPVGFGDRFFPEAVPYEYDGTSRVWYWRPALAPSPDGPSDWELVCATTHELTGVTTLPASGPSLVTDGANGTIIVVEGTVGGDVTTSHVRSYTVPDVSVVCRTKTSIELSVAGNDHTIAAGKRHRIQLSEQRVEPVETEGRSTTITPELVIRYPGQRELHHPAIGADYRLFPSFGLDMGAVPNPVSVPMAAGELDHAALADELDADLSTRPYPERVLWQAFAHTTFGPRVDIQPELTQLESGHIVLQQGNF